MIFVNILGLKTYLRPKLSQWQVVELSYQLASKYFDNQEILAVNLFGGRRTKEFAHFFFVLFCWSELYLSYKINILQRKTSSEFQS